MVVKKMCSLVRANIKKKLSGHKSQHLIPDGKIPDADQLARKRMSFLVVHDINDATPYAILKVHEDATTRDVIRQAVAKAGASARSDHDYVLLEEVKMSCSLFISRRNKKFKL